MRIFLGATTMCLALLGTSPTFSAEQTVKLSLGGLWCAGCAYIVKETLSDLDGVRVVEVSYRRKDAVVTFEDTETDVATLMAATTDAGFPSTVVE